MNPFDAIAQPFVEQDFSTPRYDRKLELDRRRSKEKSRKKVTEKEEAHEVLQDRR